eukprot:scaffold71432_cov20-Tisochrysis_lutea.AAC.1
MVIPALSCTAQVAFHFNAFEDVFEGKESGPQNLWCSDPWALLLSCRPGMVRDALHPFKHNNPSDKCIKLFGSMGFIVELQARHGAWRPSPVGAL